MAQTDRLQGITTKPDDANNILQFAVHLIPWFSVSSLTDRKNGVKSDAVETGDMFIAAYLHL